MCTIGFLVGVVADAPLVVVANRDEMYARPTRPPERLGPGLVGGVDVLSGGTWLALHRSGRFAAVTNQRALTTPPAGVRSRGLAVKELAAADDPAAYIADLDPTHYASMNLVWGDATGVSIAYARQEGALDVIRLPRGVHVLCNDKLGAPGFPRGDRLHAALDRVVAEAGATVGGSAMAGGSAGVVVSAAAGAPVGVGGGAATTAGLAGGAGATTARASSLASGAAGLPALARRLQAELADHTRVPLADVPPSHLDPALARELTATCIHSETYGTRSSTVFALAPGRVLGYFHTDGPPCTSPLIDGTPLVEAA